MTGARWVSLSWSAGCSCALSSCVLFHVSLSAPVPSLPPRGPGRSSLLIRTRTAELKLCTRPALRARLAARRQGWDGQQRAPLVLSPSPHSPSHQAGEGSKRVSLEPTGNCSPTTTSPPNSPQGGLKGGPLGLVKGKENKYILQ